MERIALGEIHVSYGVVHLVEVFLVVVRTGHALQLADFALGIRSRHNLSLSDAGVKLQLVGWVQSNDMLERLVGFRFLSQQRLNLSHQEPLTGFLLAALLMLDDLAEIGQGLLVATSTDVIVRQRVVPVFLCAVVDAVA